MDPFYIEDLNHKKILSKFLRLNNLKRQRTQDSLKQRHSEFLQLLPLLFHINHPSLPGFVSTQCPSGIAKFTPGKDSIRAARKIAKSFEYKRRAYRQYDIHALYLMGGTGTIAYSDDSDFDIWVCHREDISKVEIKKLQLKAEHISKWCLKLNLEVNFFLIHTENFRQGKIDQLSSESSGSTQHLLLLEEFYRTSILLEGRYPIWWLVPPQFEKQYDDYVENIIHKRLLNEHDFLNFGSINQINAEEFYGATLWHIYKGIDSPYKSILKLLLMECYAEEHPGIDLLCLQFKNIVYQEDTPDLNGLDPYIMMMEKITLHLIQENSLSRLELARQCLYLKVHESLTKTKIAPSHKWRHEIMNELISKWQWNHPKLLLLDRREQWKIEEVTHEHKNIMESLTYSYRKLSDYLRYQNKDARINKRDLHILGRKLYAAFEKKAGKIEIIGHDNTIYLHETHVSLHTISSEKNSSKENESGWALYIGAFNTITKTTPSPAKKSTQLLKLLCWGYFNRVINSQTSFILSKDIQILNTKEIKQILETLESIFPNAAPGHANMEELVKPAQLTENVLFLNVGIDPFLNHHAIGTQIATKQTNALNYSSQHENLLLTIDQVLLTSWREVMTQHFDGENGLLECLCHYLKWNHENETAKSSPVPKRPTLVCCFSSVRGEAISRCISQLFNNILDAFHGHDNALNIRYLFSIEQSYFIIWQNVNGTQYQRIPDKKELLRELSYPLANFNSLVIDDDFSNFNVLKLIFNQNKENHIQMFYQNHRKTADIYIIDERGSLYHQSTSIQSNSIHVNHFILFLDSIIDQLSCSSSYLDGSVDNTQHIDFGTDASKLLDDTFISSLTDLDIEEPEVDLQLEVFEIQNQVPGQLTLDEQLSKLQSMPAHFFKIQVIADLNKDGSRRYVIYANNKEFNSFEFGADIYKQVAKEVIHTRKSKQRYPIYITDIDLSPELREAEGSHGIQTTQLLKFKHEIERRLNQAIKIL